MLPKPSYYIAFRNSPIIAGLMQVEIMVIISLARMQDDGLFHVKVIVQRGRWISPWQLQKA